MGERTPHLDPFARAAFVGLSASHTRAHLIRAVLEGVAFSLKDTFTIFEEIHVPVERIRLGGGGARSPLWQQIQADVYAHEVEILKAEEGAAYGAAILAGVGSGCWKSVDEACDARAAESCKRDIKTTAGSIRLYIPYLQKKNRLPPTPTESLLKASTASEGVEFLYPQGFFWPGLK
jgi:xylulokinase